MPADGSGIDFIRAGVANGMHSAEYYRRQAVRSRQIADLVHQPEIEEMLRTAAQDYEDIAEDIDLAAIEIRHPELLPERNR